MHDANDNVRNLLRQAVSLSSTVNAVGTLTCVGTTSGGKGTKELPAAMRESVARAVEEAIATRFRGKSERAIAKALGLSQPALNQIRHHKGALGVHALLALRTSLGKSIDALLGLPSLPIDAHREAIRALLLEELPSLLRAEEPPPSVRPRPHPLPRKKAHKSP